MGGSETSAVFSSISFSLCFSFSLFAIASVCSSCLRSIEGEGVVGGEVVVEGEGGGDVKEKEGRDEREEEKEEDGEELSPGEDGEGEEEKGEKGRIEEVGVLSTSSSPPPPPPPRVSVISVKVCSREEKKEKGPILCLLGVSSFGFCG